MPESLRILFVCTGNACRSQMAEGWARHLKSGLVEPYSAGIETHGLNPLAVKVMAEAAWTSPGSGRSTSTRLWKSPLTASSPSAAMQTKTAPSFQAKPK